MGWEDELLGTENTIAARRRGRMGSAIVSIAIIIIASSLVYHSSFIKGGEQRDDMEPIGARIEPGPPGGGATGLTTPFSSFCRTGEDGSTVCALTPGDGDNESDGEDDDDDEFGLGEDDDDDRDNESDGEEDDGGDDNDDDDDGGDDDDDDDDDDELGRGEDDAAGDGDNESDGEEDGDDELVLDEDDDDDGDGFTSPFAPGEVEVLSFTPDRVGSSYSVLQFGEFVGEPLNFHEWLREIPARSSSFLETNFGVRLNSDNLLTFVAPDLSVFQRISDADSAFMEELMRGLGVNSLEEAVIAYNQLVGTCEITASHDSPVSLLIQIVPGFQWDSYQGDDGRVRVEFAINGTPGFREGVAISGVGIVASDFSDQVTRGEFLRIEIAAGESVAIRSDASGYGFGIRGQFYLRRCVVG